MRSPLVALGCVMSVWVLAGCPNLQRCDATNCTGCCSSTGVCVPGDTDTACGLRAGACVDCSLQARVCVASQCRPPSSFNDDGGTLDPDAGGGNDAGGGAD